MDELFVSLGSVWMRVNGASAAEQGAAFTAFSVGGACALVGWERLGRGAVEDRLVAVAIACGLAFVGWLGSGADGRLAWSFVLGATVAPMWPAVTARAYATGGRPGLVAALEGVLTPLEVVAPLALGLVADRYGLGAAMLGLLVQPLVVAAVALRARRR